MNWFRRPPPDPKLPPGDIGRSVIGNTFAFHNDAQGLILDNIDRYPELPVYRAKVIGKDVALVVDYRAAQDVLGSSSRAASQAGASSPRGTEKEAQSCFSKRAAYKDMMAPFFVEPNVLLEDYGEPSRPAHRASWDRHMSEALDGPTWADHKRQFREIAQRHRSAWLETGQFEVYKSCKTLARELVFRLFLGLDQDNEPQVWDTAHRLSDTSLRGQFALPLRANLGAVFMSTYTKGLQAQIDLRELVKDRIQGSQCPFAHTTSPESTIAPESFVTHTSMFASSLVVKAIASYLTFCLIQLSRPEAHNAPLEHVILETERLCPPIIGVLRRAMDPWVLGEMEIPAGWDVWLYFPLINRDAEIYGPDASRFDPQRWEKPMTPPAMSFGQGDTECLGMDLVRRIAGVVLEVLCVPQIQLGSDLVPSLRDFLGWEQHAGGWDGVKQLPVQRPRAEVFLRYG